MMIKFQKTAQIKVLFPIATDIIDQQHFSKKLYEYKTFSLKQMQDQQKQNERSNPTRAYCYKYLNEYHTLYILVIVPVAMERDQYLSPGKIIHSSFIHGIVKNKVKKQSEFVYVLNLNWFQFQRCYTGLAVTSTTAGQL